MCFLVHWSFNFIICRYQQTFTETCSGREFKPISNFCRRANDEVKLYGISRAISYDCISGIQILFLLAKKEKWNYRINNYRIIWKKKLLTLEQFKSFILLVWLSTDIMLCKGELRKWNRLVSKESTGTLGLNLSPNQCRPYYHKEDLRNGVNVTYHNYFERLKNMNFQWRSTKKKSEVSLLTDFVTGAFIFLD